MSKRNIIKDRFDVWFRISKKETGFEKYRPSEIISLNHTCKAN